MANFKMTNERLLVDELNLQLQYDKPITSTGATMTLPAASADLTDWITDSRQFVSQQYADWKQVMADFSASVKETGPKLTRHVETITAQIELLFPMLITSTPPATPASPIATFLRKLLPHNVSDGIAQSVTSRLEKLIPHPPTTKAEVHFTLDVNVREAIRLGLEQLSVELASHGAILAAWHDLWTSADNVKRPVDQIAFRRDTLAAIAQRRNLDVFGPFGLFADLRGLVGNSFDRVQEELDTEAGVQHAPTLTKDKSKEPLWRRLQLCGNVLTREPERADCIVWLRLEPATLPQNEVSHGQVTFYNAAFLTSAIGDPSTAGNFKVSPVELLNLPPAEAAPLRKGDQAWESDWRQAYARVVLPNIEIHAAESRARSLVEALKVANRTEKGSWQTMNGAILFVGRSPSTLLDWGPKEDIPDMYYPDHDRFGYDVEQMAPNKRTLDAGSLHDLEDVIAMDRTLSLAVREGPQATVMAAVRAIEHMNTWTTGGKTYWSDFVSDYFKKAQSRSRVIHFINNFSILAIKWCVNDIKPDAALRQRINQIRSAIESSMGPHTAYDRVAAAGHVVELHKIYADADHRLARGLGELESILETPTSMSRHLDAEGETFDRQLRRLKRLRNCAIHGGPVSEAGCQSVSIFAQTLAYRCLNEALKALLMGATIPTHMEDYREDSLARYDRIQRNGVINDFFLSQPASPSGKTAALNHATPLRILRSTVFGVTVFRVTGAPALRSPFVIDAYSRSRAE